MMHPGDDRLTREDWQTDDEILKHVRAGYDPEDEAAGAGESEEGGAAERGGGAQARPPASEGEARAERPGSIDGRARPLDYVACSVVQKRREERSVGLYRIYRTYFIVIMILFVSVTDLLKPNTIRDRCLHIIQLCSVLPW